MRPRIQNGLASLLRPIALIAFALTFSGCGARAPIAPNTQGSTSPAIARSPGSQPQDLGANSSLWYTVASQQVTPGVPTTVKGSRYSLRFAGGSLSNPAQITIQEYNPAVTDFQL